MLSSVERTQSTMKTYLSHDECYNLAVQLSEQIKASPKGPHYERIATVPRGGLVLAGWLSYLLDIKDIIIQSTLEHELNELQLDNYEHCSKTLIVDDLVDTGDTLQGYQDLGFTIATLCKKPWSKVEPDLCVKETEDWIVFPWEHEEQEAVRKMEINDEIA